MSLNLPYQCTFSKSDGTVQIGGVLYTAQGEVRGDFDIVSAIGTSTNNFAVHLIHKDDTAYTWTSIGPLGFKSSIAGSASKNASPTEQAQIIGRNDKEELNCMPWNANLTMFSLPSGITFTQP